MNATRDGRPCRVGLLILVACLTVAAAVVQVRLFRGWTFDGENSLTEGESLAALWRVRQRQAFYCDYRRPPHVLTQYMPLFYAAPGWSARLLNSDWWQTVYVGRAYVHGCWILVGVVIGALVRRHAGLWPAVVSMLLWWIGLVGIEWANSFRPDAPALLFSLAALWWYERNGGLTGAIGAGVLVGVALLHKQAALAAPLVLLWTSLQPGRLREATWFAVTVIVMLATVVITAHWVTSGLFTANVLTSVIVPGNWRWPLWLAVSVMLMGGAVFSGAIFALGTGASRLAPRWWKHYLLAAFGIGFVTSFKFGSWTNYYLEFLAAGCMWCGLLVEQGLRVGHSRTLAVWLVIALGYTADVIRTRCTEAIPPKSALAEVVTKMSQDNSLLLVEDSYLAVRGGSTPYLVNAANFQRLLEMGKFDDSELVRKLRDGEFAAAVTMYPLEAETKTRPFPPRWLVAVQGRYTLSQSEETSPGRGIFIYRRTSAPTATTGGVNQ